VTPYWAHTLFFFLGYPLLSSPRPFTPHHKCSKSPKHEKAYPTQSRLNPPDLKAQSSLDITPLALFSRCIQKSLCLTSKFGF